MLGVCGQVEGIHHVDESSLRGGLAGHEVPVGLVGRVNSVKSNSCLNLSFEGRLVCEDCGKRLGEGSRGGTHLGGVSAVGGLVEGVGSMVEVV